MTPDLRELHYTRGNRQAGLSMLTHCLRELGYDDSEGARVAWVKEREVAVQALRAICADFGDNDWPNDLNLADVLHKHLERHLSARAGVRRRTDS